MEHHHILRGETPATLRRLKWLFTSLGLSGAREFPCNRWGAVPSAVPITLRDSRRADGAQLLASIREEMGDCKRCRLHEGRGHLVFGEGSPSAPLVFVGEGPGFDEDRQGRPFVGRAGKLLDKMIDALQLARKDLYICNVVKCRPPGNRTPQSDETEICSTFLVRQLMAIRPRVICTLGACAARTLLGTLAPMTVLRGKVHQWRGIPLVCTFHPAYLLRNPSQKPSTLKDLREIHRILSAQEGG
ncbi:MAG: uracil-DNA glycosylase [Deltaproteobacteria bacterium]|nr:uracil-DNA glycosylase [Deltaproteobacteria bacterium]